MIRRFAFSQHWVGSYRASDGPEREQPLSLELSGVERRLLPPLSGTLAVEGVIDARGFADRRPVRGRARLGALKSEYELELTDNQGQPCRFHGTRRARLAEPLWSATTLEGRFTDANGRETARAELRLDYRAEVGKWFSS